MLLEGFYATPPMWRCVEINPRISGMIH